SRAGIILRYGLGHSVTISTGGYMVWLDATLEPDELRDAVAFMLRTGYNSDVEEWAIKDYDDPAD
ncbi:MAG: hypothetical protein LC808_43515, partial [Actinobacteria bacterium]|nr:hypothetical protein [Actinomycetota bacterium]